MTPLGWLFMLCSISAVVTLVSFCFWRVLKNPSATKRMQAPLDIDTLDREA